MRVRNEVPLASTFWLVAWALALSWGWLLPNHYLPWSGFHMDAWAATACSAMAAAVLWRTRNENRVSFFAAVVLCLTFTPLLQYIGGMIPIVGTAWLAFAYLLGFVLATISGYRWEDKSPSQLGDGLFLAIGVASVISVGLQIHQWLQLDLIEVWSMGNGMGRPFANFGQPNQLGTLLLWGVLALAWGHLRGYIRPWVLILGTVYLLFGIALTASRTAWVGLALAALGTWYWRGLWPHQRTPWVTSSLAIVFFFFVWTIPFLTRLLLLGSSQGDLDELVRISSETRPQIWILFLDAIWHRPWFGYGWNQIPSAHLAAALEHAPLRILFAQAHNLFLDLLLYCGIPIGLALCGFLVVWLWRRFIAIRDATSAVMFLTILIVGNHAMFEFPLHYAYFLLPTGLLIGALDAHLGARTLDFGKLWVVSVLWLASAALLAILVRDYLRVEASYETLRFEWANIRTNATREPPDVLVLDQLRDLIVFARFEPSAGMSKQQLDWMRNVASLYPSAGVVQKLASALVWNNQPDEAVLWFRRMCTITPQLQCDTIRTALKKQAETDPRIAAVNWP